MGWQPLKKALNQSMRICFYLHHFPFSENDHNFAVELQIGNLVFAFLEFKFFVDCFAYFYTNSRSQLDKLMRLGNFKC